MLYNMPVKVVFVAFVLFKSAVSVSNLLHKFWENIEGNI